MTRPSRTQLAFMLLAVAVAHGDAHAAERTKHAVIAAGSEDACGDVELLDLTDALRDALAREGNFDVLPPTALPERLPRAPVQTLEELRRQIETAQHQFYQAQYTRALRQVSEALAEIARHRPGPERWDLEVSARVLEGLIRTRLRGDRSNHEAFRKVLRLDPAHRLDPSYFGPSTIRLFERVRSETADAPRATLEVTSTPSGAGVFLDGREMGRTPFTAALPHGEYQLLVGTESLLSLEHEIDLSGPTSHHVDVAAEGALRAGRGVCLMLPRTDADRAKVAARVGAMFGLDRIALVNLQRALDGSRWLAAELVAVSDATGVREGAVRLGDASNTPGRVAELARFLVTGKATEWIAQTAEPASEAAPPSPPASAASRPESSGPSSATPIEIARSTRPSGYRQASFALGGLGVIAAGTGVVFLVMANPAAAELDAVTNGGLGSSPDQAPHTRALVDQVATRRTIGFSALGVGALAIGGGVALYLLDRQATSQTSDAPRPKLAVMPSPGGLALSFTGTF